jgi:outer membrane protein assembly factor BamA
LRLQVWLTEKWVLLPFPILHLNERSWSKVSYGAGVTHANLLGRGEQLSAVIKFGYNPLYQIGYAIPWLGGKKNLWTELKGWHQRVRSRHFIDKAVTEKHLGFSGLLGKRFGHHLYLSGLGRYQEITCPCDRNFLTVSPSGRDRFVDWGAFLTLDHRDLKEYPTRGGLVQCGWIQSSFKKDVFHHQRWSLDLRGYVPVRKTTIALRAATTQSRGDLPVYHRTYLGYDERIRGHFNTVTEGENRLLASAAWRMPIVPIQYISVDDAPELSDLKFGISFGLFVDTGVTYMQHENPWNQKWLAGYGAGLHFHLPYADVLRLELAFNEKGNPQWIADLFVDI